MSPAVRVCVLALALASTSCLVESTAAPPLKAATEDAAAEVVRAFLAAAEAGDAAQVAARMCNTPEGLERARAALAGPLRIRGYAIVRVEPAWVGAEPYFRVDVTLEKESESDARSLSVRAREGCVDRLLGEPVEGAKRPDPSEISL